MSKDLLNKIRNRIENEEVAGPDKIEEKLREEVPASIEQPPKPAAGNLATVKKPAKKKPAGPAVTGFEELQEILKAEKEGFSFNRRLVYVDDNIGEALDLLRKEAKINSNVLASYLLKQFLLEHKEAIKRLRAKKKGNIFFD